MSFIAAVLILNLDTADAFIAFSNLLNKPCQMAFFRVDHGLVSIPVCLTRYLHPARTAQSAVFSVEKNTAPPPSKEGVRESTVEVGGIWGIVLDFKNT